MSLGSSIAWEIRPTNGDDTNNGGGFDYASTTGTDYAATNTVQVTFNGTTITASCAQNGTTITLSGYTVALTDDGNLVTFTGGTNVLTGRYRITANGTNVTNNTWTLDRTPATAGAGSAFVGKMGGALKTIGQAVTAAGTSANKYFVKAEGAAPHISSTAPAPLPYPSPATS